MFYPYIKSIHIIFVVTWFAGLFYLVRLFIYHREAQDKEEPEKNILTRQYEIMEGRLWSIITMPSMLLATAAGLYLMFVNQFYSQPWMMVKLGFVVGLLAYHFSCGYLLKQMKAGVFRYTGQQLRLWNEVATLFLFAIVFQVVLRSALDWLWGLLGLLVLSILLMMGVRIYKIQREKRQRPKNK